MKNHRKLLAFSILVAAGSLGIASTATAQPVKDSFPNTTFTIKNPGQEGYKAPVHKPGPFDKTIFTIRNPGEPGFVKREGNGGGAKSAGGSSGL